MTAHAFSQSTTPLAEVDSRIAATPHGALTLDPHRGTASALSELVERLADERQRPHLAIAASSVAEAQLECFPENLLWDFDFFLASVHGQATAATDYVACLEEATRVTVGLMRLYGQQSVIQFRYVHDFMYGFDWARWVRRDPESRAQVEPFSVQFLKQVEVRGQDILDLIEADDAVYPRIDDGAPRNPFPFSREPDEELRLYRSLSERGYIPIEAWRLDAQPDATRDFDAIRENTARRLGIDR